MMNILLYLRNVLTARELFTTPPPGRPRTQILKVF